MSVIDSLFSLSDQSNYCSGERSCYTTFIMHFHLKYVLREGKGFKLNWVIMRVTYLTKVGGYKNSNLKEISSFYLVIHIKIYFID